MPINHFLHIKNSLSFILIELQIKLPIHYICILNFNQRFLNKTKRTIFLNKFILFYLWKIIAEKEEAAAKKAKKIVFMTFFFVFFMLIIQIHYLRQGIELSVENLNAIINLQLKQNIWNEEIRRKKNTFE